MVPVIFYFDQPKRLFIRVVGQEIHGFVSAARVLKLVLVKRPSVILRRFPSFGEIEPEFSFGK
jgi:hypothetical protein